MKEFYTKVERMGNDILWCGYDEDGEKFFRKVKYQPTLYVSDRSNKDSEYVSLIGDHKLKPIKMDTMKACTDFIESYSDVENMTICGNNNYTSAFIHEHYPDNIEFDASLIHTFMFDIEVDISNGTAILDEAGGEITSIAVKSSNDNDYHMFGTKDYCAADTITGIDPSRIKYHQFNNERELLKSFIKLWTSDYPDVITGWNCMPVDTNIWGVDKIHRLDRVTDNLHDSKVVARSPISSKEEHQLNLGTGQVLRSSADHKYPVTMWDPNTHTKLRPTRKTPLDQGVLTAEQISQKIADGIDVYVDVVIRENTNPNSEKYTDEELYLAGLIYTDGTLCKKNTRSDGYRIFQSNYPMLKELDGLGLTTSIVGPHKGCWSRGVSQSNISRNAHDLIYDDTFKKRLNVSELSVLSYRQFMLFISGCLDGDGYISHNTIELCNFNQDLLSFQEICLWNGVVTTISPKANSIRFRRFNFADLTLRNRKRWDGFVPHVKDATTSQKSSVTKFKVIDGHTIRTKVMSVVNTGRYVDMMDIETDTHLFVARGVRVHNCELFDVAYIVKRIRKVLGDVYVKKLSPWGIVRERTFEMFNKTQVTYVMSGISVVDYMNAFKKFGYKYGTMQSYKLDNVASVVLGTKKISYSEYGTLTELYRRNPQLYLDYNLYDTKLIEMLEDEAALMDLTFTVAYKSGVNFNEAFGTIQVWDTTIYRKLMSQNTVPFVKKKADMHNEHSISGGYVKDPDIGMKQWVVSFDLNSLYPMLMMQYNMSPETYQEHVREEVTQEEILSKLYTNQTKYAVAANGACFAKDKAGVIPQIIEGYYSERAEIKQNMLKAEGKLELIKEEMQRRRRPS
jgi:hypothetical protein